MFELIFGTLWTIASVFITFVMYSGVANTVEVNGEQVSQVEFNAMLLPKILMGIFIFVGLFMMFLGIRKIVKNTLTKLHGAEVYGVVVDISHSGTYVNDRPQLKADVMIMVDGSMNRYSEVIGFDWNKYKMGDFVLVKHYQNDINILKRVEGHEVPYSISQALEGFRDNQPTEYTNYSQQTDAISGDDVIVLNGVRYKKID